MQEHNFDKILDYLCSEIAMKSEQEIVRDELYDHLMCKYETNIACGLNDAQAVESAIKDLGDVEKMKNELGAVHGFAPKPAMKRALGILRVGYMLAFAGGALKAMFGDEILSFLGSVLFLLGVFALSKANEKLKRAFYLFSVSFVLICVLNALMPDWFGLFNFNIPFGIVIFILNVLFSAYLMGGLYELVKPYESIKPMKNKLKVAFVLNLVLSVVQLILFTAYYSDNSYAVGNYKIPVAITIVCACTVNLALWDMSNLLFDSDHEYKTETSVSKNLSVVIIALLVGILPAVCVDVCYSLQKAETSEHIIDDSDISQAEYNRICDNLLSYGVPEEIVYSLPESEIEKYGDSLNLSELDKTAQNYYLKKSGAERNNFEGVVTEANSWAIVLKDGNVRVISYMKYIEGSKGFIDGAFWDSSLSTSVEEEESDFVLVLSKENGKTLRNEPIETYVSENGSPYGVNGVCFEAKNGLTVIYAQTFTDNKPGQAYNYIINSYIRKTPFAFLCRTPYDAYYMPLYRTVEYAHNQAYVDFESVISESES